MREQGKSEADKEARGRAKGMREGGKVESTRKGRWRGRGSIYAARAVGPCEDANLTERHTRLGRPPFPDAATACSTLQRKCQPLAAGCTSIPGRRQGNAQHRKLQDRAPSIEAGSTVGGSVRGNEGVEPRSDVATPSQYKDL